MTVQGERRIIAPEVRMKARIDKPLLSETSATDVKAHPVDTVAIPVVTGRRTSETSVLAQNRNYSFAVFPFLKTGDAVPIGHLTFRSTDDTRDLSAEQVACVREIASMLFLQDNLRIKSASYAVIPFVDLNQPQFDVGHLMYVQAFVAYCYASPRHEFGDLFLSSEHASIAVFTPGRVLIHIVRPDFHLDSVEPGPDLTPDNHGEIEGYAGLYNFRHHFWVAKGSRLYGPRPRLTLNHSQDLSVDLHRMVEARADYQLLNKLVSKPNTEASSRIFTAVRWFNAANNEANDDATAIVNLAIAFESLLRLPRSEKTDRLTDSISLLLGRIPRRDIWAQQFYEARSRIVHEGCVQQSRFVATNSQKVGEGPLYQSLLSYGRQVFQLCLGTVLVGAELGENASLEEKLVTNQERFDKICKLLADETTATRQRLERIAPIVATVKQYQFVSESDLRLDAMIGATRLAAKAFLDLGEGLTQEQREHLERLVTAKRTEDHLQELEALRALDIIFPEKPMTTETICSGAFRDLVKVVWSYVFMHYFWLKERLPGETSGPSSPAKQVTQP